VECMLIPVLFWDDESISGSWDTLTKGGGGGLGGSILVLSWDGQSISESLGTLTMPCPRMAKVASVVSIAMTTVLLYPKNGMVSLDMSESRRK